MRSSSRSSPTLSVYANCASKRSTGPRVPRISWPKVAASTRVALSVDRPTLRNAFTGAGARLIRIAPISPRVTRRQRGARDAAFGPRNARVRGRVGTGPALEQPTGTLTPIEQAEARARFGKRFGDDSYAVEELVAELGAAFLCADLGNSDKPRADYAQYLDHRVAS
jgi:Zincin-like metallopeptidase